ncbi:DUF947-domain-containing protein [Punctularia strigosozonata HHB-11173 SS5]|uniref:DUF947-domain-containing protein n=1 Tax=Punctularia strigosozonata (strain HHB-11173) TaxID=741275 RepID=UPI0004417B7B|nr:DUF947-domain-containing protein [Punctularia strigosozonata HHB-11173 SS5]EIN13789.1 DUF947-domain-containing protein [Punctularia strigosozonata HHB-11173 SS5]
MPRRPRPQSRRSPQQHTTHSATGSAPREREQAAGKVRVGSSDSRGDAQKRDGESDFSEASDEELVQEDSAASEDEDVDAPRFVQWTDDDSMTEGEAQEPSTLYEITQEDMVRISQHLASLPFGALRKAQHALSHAEAESSSDDDSRSDTSESEEERRDETMAFPAKEGTREWTTRPRKDLAKRPNKHAPTEITSKKPVTRRRTVVDVPKAATRDPRFMPLAGEFAPEKFRKQYDFLAELHEQEHKELRENLKRARKLLASSPRDLRAEREAEVKNLEAALKRAESAVNKDKRERVEHAALEKVSREEKERRKSGKQAWYMKNADKRELLTKARYEALAASGGTKAVKRAIEKRQKKVSQKEKKSRPFAPQSTDGRGKRRERPVDDGYGPRKRARL